MIRDEFALVLIGPYNPFRFTIFQDFFDLAWSRSQLPRAVIGVAVDELLDLVP
jgi:hypothetical protein